MPHKFEPNLKSGTHASHVWGPPFGGVGFIFRTFACHDHKSSRASEIVHVSFLFYPLSLALFSPAAFSQFRSFPLVYFFFTAFYDGVGFLSFYRTPKNRFLSPSEIVGFLKLILFAFELMVWNPHLQYHLTVRWV